MCWGKFINCNKCNIQVEDVDNKLYHACGGAIWEISEPSSQFCCEPKTSFKNSENFPFDSSKSLLTLFIFLFVSNVLIIACCSILWCWFKIFLRYIYYLCHFKVGICFLFCFVLSFNLRFSWFLQQGKEGNTNYLLPNRTVCPAFPLSLCWHLVGRFFSWFLRTGAGINATQYGFHLYCVSW